MPMNRKSYPRSWDLIAYKVKSEANWTCEECGKECRKPGEDLMDFIKRTSGAIHCVDSYERLEHPQRYALTVSHTDHVPRNCDRSNLRALCAPCHCRYDLRQMGTKQRIKRERMGQLNFLTPDQGTP